MNNYFFYSNLFKAGEGHIEIISDKQVDLAQSYNQIIASFCFF